MRTTIYYDVSSLASKRDAEMLANVLRERAMNDNGYRERQYVPPQENIQGGQGSSQFWDSFNRRYTLPPSFSLPLRAEAEMVHAFGPALYRREPTIDWRWVDKFNEQCRHDDLEKFLRAGRDGFCI